MLNSRTHLAALAVVCLVGVGCGGPTAAPEAIAQGRAPIIGGVPEPARPYVVGIGQPGEIDCSATVISRRTLLTAAHCTDNFNTAQPTVAFFGPDASAPTVPVVEAALHPGWGGGLFGALSHDLALLKLGEDALHYFSAFSGNFQQQRKERQARPPRRPERDGPTRAGTPKSPGCIT